MENLDTHYRFESSDEPDFIIFGPYGNDVPEKGAYTRIGYFCENIKPDLSVCEWAFGVPREEDIQHPNYKRIFWHGLRAEQFIKPAAYDPEKILSGKTKFCNFLYSHHVPYREAFFSQLSKYKKVDAPGRSMNNMSGIDSMYAGDKWEIKRQFLSPYKFTIAFENDIFPGYQTEKLYDAMLADTLPVYCGDPDVGDVFNTKSFINAFEFLPAKHQQLVGRIGRWGQMDFQDIRPAFLTGPAYRVKRKLKSGLREFKTGLRFPGKDFSRLIDQVIAVDSNPELYLKYLNEPWFKQNKAPVSSSSRDRWIQIFNSR